ncbi:hypothetical protein ACIQPT_28900 [Streptomyces sp. NPDC091289]|uniref:hypothetical protein n=1 Tax=Streptomyces sp. NPDC091289 TaxID=3365989 RepID=UPI003824F6F8
MSVRERRARLEGCDPYAAVRHGETPTVVRKIEQDINGRVESCIRLDRVAGLETLVPRLIRVSAAESAVRA